MADGTQTPSTELARLEPAQRAPARTSHDAVAAFDTAKFDQMIRIAKGMAMAPSLPDHLKGKGYDDAVGNCLAIVEQSHRWGLSPFAVAQATYFVHGKIGYEGKLIAAALQSTLGIKLSVSFAGKEGTPQRSITLSDDAGRKITGTVEQWQTRNKEGKVNGQWINQPDDQLIYRGTRQWCRRYEPGVILGIYTPDELEEAGLDEPRDITPPAGPPPAPKRAEAVRKTQQIADSAPAAGSEPFLAEVYMTRLEGELVIAAQSGHQSTLQEAWDPHMEGYHARLNRDDQQKAEGWFRKHTKEIAAKAKAAKDKPADAETMQLPM